MTSFQREIITDLNSKQFAELVKKLTNNVLVIKFTAEWCGPCKKIKPTVDKWFNTLPDNIILAEIDIDENLDLYMAFKRIKQIKGVPTIFAYYGNRSEENNFLPNDSVVGGDVMAVNAFFERVATVAITLK